MLRGRRGERLQLGLELKLLIQRACRRRAHETLGEGDAKARLGGERSRTFAGSLDQLLSGDDRRDESELKGLSGEWQLYAFDEGAASSE